MRIFFTTLLVFESFFAILSAASHDFTLLAISLVFVVVCLIRLGILPKENKEK